MNELLRDLRRLLFLLGESTAGRLLPTGLLSILVALLSVLSAGSILPLVIVLQSGPQGLVNMPLLSGLSWGGSAPSIVPTLLCVALFALAFMLKALAAICLYRRQAATSLFIQCRLASRIHGHYLNLPLSTVVRQNPADLALEMREGVDAASGMASHLILMAGDAAVLIGLLSLLLLMNPIVGAAVILALALFTRPVLAANKAATRRIGAALNAALAGVMRHMADLFALSRELRVYRAQEFFRKRFDALQGEAAAMKARQEYLRALPSTIIEFSAVIIVLTLVAIMVLTLRSDEIIKLLSVYGIAAFRIIPSINRLTASLIALRLTRSSVAAVVGRMESVVIPEPTGPERPAGLILASVPATSAVRLEHVSYRHEMTASWLLRDVGFELAPGRTYGIYGPSGSGKSTLLDLLANLASPSEGRIEIFGSELRAALGTVPGIAYVPQSVGLIAGTVRDNVLLGHELSADDRDIQEALRAGHALPFLQDFPAGLETAIGAGGLPLSGGQRKRIGIARALIRQPSLLLLDEATSSLDENAEADLIRGLRLQYPDMTILIVSHRASTRALCSQVLSFEGGRLVLSDCTTMGAN